MTDFKMMQLTEVCRVYQPETISKKSLPSNGIYPVYGANGKIGYNDKFNHEDPQLLLGCRGSVGSIHISEAFSWINGNAMVVQPFEDVVTRDYLKYALLGGINIKGAISGTAQPQITRESLSKINIPVPSLKNQNEIVKKLERAFAEIDLIEDSIIVELNFIDNVFQSLIDTNFENLGEDSQIHRLEDFCTKIQDGAHFSPKEQLSEPKEGWFPYLTSKNVRNNYVDLKGVTYIDSDFHRGIFQRCNPEFGDLLLTKDGVNTGNVTINTLDFPFSLLSSVCIIKVKKETLDPTYLKFYLQSTKGNRNILGDMTGAAIKRIILRTIKNLQIPIVDLKTQKELGELIENNLISVNAYKSGLAKKISLVKSLRQSLLNVAFTQEEAVA